MGGGCCVGDIPVVREIKYVVESIKDALCSDCCVGVGSGPSDSERHAQKVANELAEMKDKVNKTTEKKERDIIEFITASMNSFMKEIEGLNKQSYGGVTLNINVKSINDKNKNLEDAAVGCISGVMNKRLVQTDKDLSIILAERDDKKRKENFEAFVSKVNEEAISKFKDTMKKTVLAQAKVVSDEIEVRKREVDDRMEESIRELIEIMEIKEKSNTELELKQVNYMYQSSLCDLLLTEVEG